MGNCLQASETDHVDLLHGGGDSESVSTDRRSARSSIDSTGGGGDSQSRETTNIAADRPARSAARRRSSRNGSTTTEGAAVEQTSTRHRDSTRRRNAPLPPPYETAILVQRSGGGAPSVDVTSPPGPTYHPSPGVSRQASELTEEEQIKIAQRIGLIQHLPVDIYAEGSKTDKECIICMVEFVDGDRYRFLPCLHTYHLDCIDEWLMRSFSCPSCLEPVDSALLTSYDQQQLLAAAFTATGGSYSDDGGGGGSDSVGGLTCQSLPRQLEQLTATTSPSSTTVLIPSTESGNCKSDRASYDD